MFLSLAAICCISTNKAFAQSPAIIDMHFKALIQHDVKAIANGYAEDAQVYSPNWEGAKTGTAGITEVYTRYFVSTPDLTYKINNIINAGENIVVEYSVNGTLSNPEGNTPDYMKGKKYTLNYCAIFTVKNGKIIKETDYFDQVAFLRQVGFFDQH
jgi:steroid delta-isomerase-like uncharacterized protein